MALLFRIPRGVSRKFERATWFRVWEIDSPTTVKVDAAEFGLQFGDALQAPAGRTFRSLQVDGGCLLEVAFDPREAFPGPVARRNGCVLVYDSGILAGAVDHDASVDLRGFSSLLVDAYDATKTGGLYLTHELDDESALIYDFTAVGAKDSVLFGWPAIDASAMPDAAGGNRVHDFVSYPSPLPRSALVHLIVAAATDARLRVWGRV